MGEANRLLSGLWTLCGIAVAAMFAWAGFAGGFGAGPLIGIAGGVGIAIWQGRRIFVQTHHAEEVEDEWY